MNTPHPKKKEEFDPAELKGGYAPDEGHFCEEYRRKVQYTQEDILSGIREILVEVLAVEPEEVLPEAQLVRDLGVESLDYLDIAFRLEKHFQFQGTRYEIFPGNIAQISGSVDPQMIKEFEEKMPHADFTAVKENPIAETLQSIYTVQFLINYISQKLVEEVR